MSIMGLDYGTKRIGVAISDPWENMSLPLETIAVRADKSHMDRIREIIDEYEISRIVVGLPYNMDGTLSPMAEEVMAWAEDLTLCTGLEVVFWDERLTTSQAHDFLLSHAVRGRRRRQVVDKIAASLILKDYLDAERL